MSGDCSTTLIGTLCDACGQEIAQDYTCACWSDDDYVHAADIAEEFPDTQDEYSEPCDCPICTEAIRQINLQLAQSAAVLVPANLDG